MNTASITTPLSREETIRAIELITKEMSQKFGTKIIYKEESRLMRTIGRLTFWNKKFMTNMITTMRGNIYVPKSYQSVVERREADTRKLRSYLTVLFHEYVHIERRNKTIIPGWFEFKYITPQVYAIFGFVSLLLTPLSPWFLAGSPLLLAVLPWASKHRTEEEMRGYSVNVVCLHYVHGLPTDKIMTQGFENIFEGPSYYWMVGHPLTRKVFRGRLLTKVRQYLHECVVSVVDKQPMEHLHHVYRTLSKAK